MYQSAWLDNSSYVFLTGAVHLWACYGQRNRPRFLLSLALVASTGLTFQLHLDALILVIAAALLWLRGYWKPHWGGVAVGAVITFGTLIPFVVEATAHKEVIPCSAGYPGRSLVMVWPVLKGFGYWFRYASLSCTTRMLAFDFTPAFGATADGILAPIYSALGRGIAHVTVLSPLLANLWIWRRRRPLRRLLPADRLVGRAWLGRYAVWLCAACFIANALSPAPVMWWHNLIAFPGTLLPVVLWASALLRTRRAPLVNKVVLAYAIFAVVLLAGMAVGAKQYRFGGRKPKGIAVNTDHEILHDLRITETCPITVAPQGGLWPRQGEYFYKEYVRPFAIPPPAEKETKR
jgi:hypothetical protein